MPSPTDALQDVVPHAISKLWMSLVAFMWLLTRLMMLAELGYWRTGTHVNYEDVNVFQSWAARIALTGPYSSVHFLC